MKSALVNIGRLVTMSELDLPHRGPLTALRSIANGLLVWEGETLVYAGEMTDFEADVVHDAGGGLVTPGLIDCHTHAVFAGCRANEFESRIAGKSYAEIKAAGGGIAASVRQVASASESELLAQSQAHLSDMLACGTTAAEIKSGYSFDHENELKMLRVARQLDDLMPVRTTALVLHAYQETPDAHAQIALNEWLPEIRKHGLADAVDCFVESGYFEPRHAQQLAGAGLPLRMHVDQFGDSGGACLAAELGAVSADHLEFTGDAGIEALSKSHTCATLLPTSVHCLALDHYPRARDFMDHGAIVCLATDFNPGTSPCPSLPFVMNLACLKMKMTAAEALVATTVNPAHSLRLPAGQLVPGNLANIVVWNAESYEEIPYWCARPLVRNVFVRGNLI